MTKFVTVHQGDEIIVGDTKYRVNATCRFNGVPTAEIDIMRRGDGVWLTGDFVQISVPSSRRMKLDTFVRRVNQELLEEEVDEFYY